MTTKTLSGYHTIYGYFFDLATTLNTVAMSRVLSIWHPGVRLLQFPRALFVVFNESKLVDCQLAPAYPLIKLGNSLCSVSIDKQTLQEVMAQHNIDDNAASFVVMSAGRLQCYAMSEAESVDLSQWIDIDDYSVLPTSTLGKVPNPPQVEPLGEEKPLHSIFNAADLKPAAAKAAFLQALQEKKEFTYSDNAKKANNPLRRLLAWFTDKESTAADSLRSNGINAMNDGATARGGGVVKKLKAYLSRSVMTSRLGKVLARRQARYFRKMLEMFDNGDLREALRHAVPLQSARDAFDQAANPALGLPSPRANLNINMQQTAANRNYHFENEFFDHIKQLYRRSFEQLDRAGRYKEAAFVLAELLQEAEEAVNYLEKKGQLRLAAELAEGRKVAPAIVIRQWVIAGDVERAINIAILTGAFSHAVNLLHNTHPEEADKLKVIWGKFLATAGMYTTAVDVVWPVSTAKGLALRWIDAAISEGGESGARMLARKIAVCEDEYDTLSEKVKALMLDEESVDESQQPAVTDATCRDAFVSALTKEPTNESTRSIARLALRSLVRDYGQGRLSVNKSQLGGLLDLAGQRALRTDMPDFHAVATKHKPDALRTLTKPKQYIFEDTGTSAVFDVRAVSAKRYLVALGEAGARLINHRGRLIKHFPVPAYKFIVSDSANRAIVLSRRGAIVRLVKMDLTQLSYQEWCEAQFDGFCDTYDGFTWCISKDNQVMAIDVQVDSFKALWQIADLPGRVISMARNQHSIGLLMETEQHWESWRYEMPGFMLRQRAVLQTKALNRENLYDFTIAPNATVYALQAYSRAGNPETIAQVGDLSIQLLQFKEENTPKLLSVDLPNGEIGATRFSPDWAVVPVMQDKSISMHVIDIDTAFKGKTRLQVALPNTRIANYALLDNQLIVFDETGQIQVINLQDGTLEWRYFM